MELKTREELQGEIEKGVLLVHFWATWCQPCASLDVLVGKLIDKNSKMVYAKVEAEKYPSLSEEMKINAVPTFLFFNGGKEIFRIEGAQPQELTKKILELNKVTPISTVVSLEKRLDTLINQDAVMLFMKGNPQEPKCGFSRQMIEILNSHQIKYSTFDILTDQTVRDGLKEYSKWPTYPQLYSKGKLVGGLDIVKELVENDELMSSLGVVSLNDRLKSLVNQSPVVLFMKGNPQEPKCGFSAKTVAILNENKVAFTTFDILSDNAVREGLRTYSNWPTYPQLYSRGKLIGGFDIVKDLNEEGELLSALQ